MDSAALEFFKQQTGVTGEDELNLLFKQKLSRGAVLLYLRVRIHKASHADGAYTSTVDELPEDPRLTISRHPKYQSILQLASDHTGALLLDIGCCFGNDARKAVVDGWPATLSSDIRQGTPRSMDKANKCKFRLTLCNNILGFGTLTLPIYS
ncbi:hypothetical protein AZE42_00976 [Rhizopogon vesiculosus]|uniref:Uncharacterized protein n=1 Tax=Rhizopogon vesiculosus TaxID=180088 RepID=A0A1J8PGN3_9AGAM|nr:hypothetical protein AZE42_00976 [Rhizopogon vesiculosus]